MPLDLSALNESQRAAATAEPGTHLVIAGAGTGKTRTLTHRAAWLLAEGHVREPARLLLLTFTNKAARSMQGQTLALLGADKADLLAQGTFHGRANRILREFGSRVGVDPNYTILDEEDARSLVRATVAEELGRPDHFFPAPAVLVDVFSYSFNRRLPLDDAVLARAGRASDHIDEIRRVRDAFSRRKREANCLDYDDLLRQWRLLLDDDATRSELAGRYTEILVDEYQDTNGVQGEIADILAAGNGGRLMVVGDDCQSIYAFRGANYENILGFLDRHPGATVHRLEDNYRSTAEILELANLVIRKNSRQHHKTLRPARPTHGPRPRMQPLPNVHAEALWVARRVLAAYQDGLPLSAMAVLYRSHSHGVALQAELLKMGLPHEVRSGVRFFEKAHIKDVVAMLKILVNPADEVAWIRVLGLAPGVGPKRARKVIEWTREAPSPLEAMAEGASQAVLPPSVREAWGRFEKDLADLYAKMGEGVSPGELVRQAAAGVYDEVIETQYRGAVNRRQEIGELANLADSYRGVQAFLAELVLLGELYGADGGGGHEDSLVLSSVHQAKGLEWEKVFILRASDDAFPAPGGLNEEGGEEEERRIFYVAATRARRELVFSYPIVGPQWGAGAGAGGMVCRPSRFLIEGRDALESSAARARPAW